MAPNTRDFHGIPSPRKRSLSCTFVCPKLNEPPKHGEIFCDYHHKKWRLGRCIGAGAFGVIFIASDDITRTVGSDAPYVIKMEPHLNGPLFVEMNFYLRVGQEELIEEWKKARGLKVLGMPTMLGFGSHTIKSEKYRFIVIPRYGENVHSLFIKQGRRFHVKTAFTIASHTLDVLEYIHSRGYLHLDIKGQNMLLGDGNGSAPLYLVDFGLATKFRIRGRHKGLAEAQDQRIAEAGTLEYSSRRSHVGVMSRRDDLESLAFNLVHWLSGWLPWLDELHDAELVLKLKQQSMDDPSAFLSSAFHPHQPPPALYDYLLYINKLGFKTKPDYDYCRQLFSQAISTEGYAPDKIISFDSHAKLRKSKKRKIETENNVPLKKRKVKRPSVILQRKPCSTQNDNISTRVTRTQADGPTNFDWATVLAGHPEKNIKKLKKIELNESIRSEPEYDSQEEPEPDDGINNPTPEMLDVLYKMMKKRESRRGRKHKVSEKSYGPPSYLTPAMRAVIARKQSSDSQPAVNFSAKSLRSSKRKIARLSNDAIVACGRF